MWIQTGVTVRKRLSWVVTSVTLPFDLRPWSLAWSLPWSWVIIRILCSWQRKSLLWARKLSPDYLRLNQVDIWNVLWDIIKLIAKSNPSWKSGKRKLFRHMPYKLGKPLINIYIWTYIFRILKAQIIKIGNVELNISGCTQHCRFL